ncbi:hypothetical protein K440DRAFT_641428 [Wilcoxina mikolae CBS 423.85]|nr:hypothetical protein K440DRAFT_641428 [Wilcoxina mikolae CBS 423.85]
MPIFGYLATNYTTSYSHNITDHERFLPRFRNDLLTLSAPNYLSNQSTPFNQIFQALRQPFTTTMKQVSVPANRRRSASAPADSVQSGRITHAANKLGRGGLVRSRRATDDQYVEQLREWAQQNPADLLRLSNPNRTDQSVLSLETRPSLRPDVVERVEEYRLSLAHEDLSFSIQENTAQSSTNTDDASVDAIQPSTDDDSREDDETIIETFTAGLEYDFSGSDYSSSVNSRAVGPSPRSHDSDKTIPWARNEDFSLVSTEFTVTHSNNKRCRRIVKSLNDRGYPLASILKSMGFDVNDMEYGAIITKQHFGYRVEPVFLQFYTEMEFYRVLESLEEWQPVTRVSVTFPHDLQYDSKKWDFAILYDTDGNIVSDNCNIVDSEARRKLLK